MEDVTARAKEYSLKNLLERKIELEYRIVSLSFFVMFYNELVEKFAAQKNKDMLEIIRQHQGLTQKLAIRFNDELRLIETRIELLKTSN